MKYSMNLKQEGIDGKAANIITLILPQLGIDATCKNTKAQTGDVIRIVRVSSCRVE